MAEVDAMSVGDLEQVFKSNDVVVATLGQDTRLGLATATAAASARNAYLDSTAEATFVRHVFGLEALLQGAAAAG